VPQDLFLFSGSIADNISLGREGTVTADVVRAAAAVNASAFIERHPDGYQRTVLEEGKALSTGEKQLLSFARAFLLDPQLVIMDEATASIDAESEHLIEGALHTLFDGRTAIIIAHRLSTIRSVDRIIVLHQGEVAEQGSHEQLLQHDGVYAKLYRMQLLAGSGNVDSAPVDD
jgi:ATP-binding cassette subfamily B protein